MFARSFPLLAAAALCAASPAPAQPLDEALDRALEVFFRNEIEAAAPLIEALAVANPYDPDVVVWLADVHLRLNSPDEAMVMARWALSLQPCHSAAHNLIASAYTRWLWAEPGGLDSLWTHARAATECAPDDGNAWLGYWMAGSMRRDTAAERQAQRRLAAIGFIPEPVMERARWILRSAPPGAVLVASGDWDYFPMGVAQTVEGLRPDVELVQQVLLEFPWYVRWIAARTGLPLPLQVARLGDDEWMPPQDGAEPLPRAAVAGWAQAALAGGARPLVIAATADAEWVKPVVWPRLDGGVYTLHPLPEDTTQAPAPEMDRIAASLRHLDVARLAGPLVHPTDRSPVRRTESHPANLMVWFAGYLAIGRHNQGDGEGAREALAWGDRVLATGAVREDHATWFAEVRGQIEDAPAVQP